MRLGSLCTGTGELDRAANLGFAAGHGDLEWVAETDPAAEQVLAQRWPKVPNLGDLTTVEWERVPRVDVITAGWPCQPWSQAGQRKGTDDERAIWPYVQDSVRRVRPRFVFLENVPGIIHRGELARATAGLSSLGYVGAWLCLRASDVGACHRRDRVFVLAENPDLRPFDDRRGSASGSAESGGTRTDPGGRSGVFAAHAGHDARAQDDEDFDPAARDLRPAPDAESQRRAEGLTQPARVGRGPDAPLGRDAAADTDRERRDGLEELHHDAPVRRVEPVGHPDRCRLEIDWGRYRAAIEQWEQIIGRPAPAPTDIGQRGSARLAPRFVEWMFGMQAGLVTAVPGLSRSDQLRVLGNSVVWLQALRAYQMLNRTLRDEVAP